ncbi:MAG TPA: penicillin acylase family protein [Ferruginibacter sp.]|nr:peptidase S45 [Chitinophagaceae bacterium]HRI23669.1 penicillin acylase family protein [Ferruginibacter sp.]
MKNFLPGLLSLLLIQPAVSQTRINPAAIDIVRDSFGVPHIFAKTDAEVAYGLAWAEAEDDFASMQEVILPAKNLMASVQGKKGAAGDYAFALFRCREVTEEKWSTLTPAFVKLINGYVQGLNEYARKHPEEVLHPKIFPVTPKEYISSAVFALTIFNGADQALFRIFNNNEWETPELNKKGSNSAAINAGKTTTGEAFLLINAHQPNTGPQAFYEAHLCSEEGLNIMGGLLAGGPCILHGVNENLGWAHTVNYCDRLDEFQLEMNPVNPLQYKFDGQWVNLEVKTIKLKIKGIPLTVKRKIYWSKYGATMKNKQGFFSIRLGANMKIGVLDQWYQMDKAKNFSEFYAAISRQELSMFNIMYADRYDTTFYISNAMMPIRDSSASFNWKRTVPGNTSKTLWTDFRSEKDLPQYINPKSGFLFNTNHSPFLATAAADNLKPSSFSKTDGWEQYHLNRSVRFLELFPQQEKLSYEKFKQIKFDKQLPAVLQYTYKIDSMFLLNAAEYPALAPLITTFKSWDKRGDAGSKGAAIFLLTYEYLKKKLQGQPPRSITKTEAVETFSYVNDYMQHHFGQTDLTLGDIQKLVRGDKDWPLGGFPDLLAPQWTEPYYNGRLKSVGGDGLIMFVRFAKNELPKIETLNMYGASAKPGTKHFDDQVEMYLQQKTKPMTLDKNVVYKNAERIYHPE